MIRETSKIAPIQFAFSIACFIQSSSLAVSFIFPSTKQDSWWVFMLSAVLSLGPIWVCIKLMQAFPNMNLIEITRHVFGRVIGYILSILYAAFFLTLTAINLRYLGSFIRETIMPLTPMIVTMGTCIAICAWASRYGLSVMMRYGSTFTFITVFIILLSFVLAANLYDWGNFLPMFDQRPLDYVQSAHISIGLFFSPIMAYLMITPHIRPGKKKMSTYWILGFAIGAATTSICVIRDTAALGNTLELFTLPFFETLRLIRFSSATGKLESFFLVMISMVFFNKIMISYYVSIVSIQEIFHQPTYKPFIWLVGALVLIYAEILYPSFSALIRSARTTIPLIWTPITILLPALTLAIAKLRGLLPREVENPA